MKHFRFFSLTFFYTCLLLLLLTPPLHSARKTAHLQLNSKADFEAGFFSNTVVNQHGQLMLAAQVARLAQVPQPFIWALHKDENYLVVATGNRGGLYFFDADYQLVFETVLEASEVTSIVAVGGGAYYIGSGPAGKLYRVEPASQSVELVLSLEGKFIWDLQLVEKTLYLATGDNGGVLYRLSLDQQLAPLGTPSPVAVFEEENVVEVAFYSERLYVTTAGKGRFYRVAPITGKKTLLYEASEGGEITTFIPLPSKTGFFDGKFLLGLYSAAQSESGEVTEENFTGPPQEELLPPSDAPPLTPKTKNYLVLVSETEGALALFPLTVPLPIGKLFLPTPKSTEKVIVALADEGEIFSLNLKTLEHTPIFSKANFSFSSFFVAPETLYFSSSASGEIFKLDYNDYASYGVYETKRYEVGENVSWGKAHFNEYQSQTDSKAKVKVSVRYGTTETPEAANWTPYFSVSDEPVSRPLGKLQRRFAQFRFELFGHQQQTPKLGEIKLYYSLPNRRERVFDFKLQRYFPPPMEFEGAALPLPDNAPAAQEMNFFEDLALSSRQYFLSWQVENLDQDVVRYRIFYRNETLQQPWTLLKDNLTGRQFLINNLHFSDGRYRFQLEYDDAFSNDEEEHTGGALFSPLHVIDNTPPVLLTQKKEEGEIRKIYFSIQDQLSPLKRVKYGVGNRFYELAPLDGVFDELREEFVLPLPERLFPDPEGVTVLVTVFDAGDNMATFPLKY